MTNLPETPPRPLLREGLRALQSRPHDAGGQDFGTMISAIISGGDNFACAGEEFDT